jgi:4-hydroxythreonine-4-phosphate dehydrogenase
MMLLNENFRFSLVTRHIPLKKVATSLTSQEIYKTILLTHLSLRKLFGIKKPRIAVCGLNPHASDNGILGNEEKTIIIPALKRLKGKISSIVGPLPADVAIGRAAKEKYDCLIAMYHDQALIPLKIAGTYTGVNLTLGLPFIRTSPLHGTAFDIAQKPYKACADSMIEAIKLAVKCSLNRRRD